MKKKQFLAQAVQGSLLVLAIAGHAYAADPAGLSAQSSAELQKLLAVPRSQMAVVFANHQPPRAPSDTFDRLFMWNEVALDTTAIDHTPLQPGEIRVFGEQYGPTRSSRAMAIAHIAMFEAVNAIAQKDRSYAGVKPVTGNVSLDYAIAQSMHDALVYLYPSQKERLDAILAIDASRIPGDKAGEEAGQALGKRAAAAIIKLRTNDGSQVPDPMVGGPFTPIGGVGHWKPDPISKLKIYLGAYWANVKPFTLASSSQFRAPPPPALTDKEYTKAFHQEENVGGDPRFGTPTGRSQEQTFMAKFWSYDGTPALCAPPRLYNQVARTIALQQGLSNVPEAARLLALINTAMADAAISAWDAKWYYQFWRPVTAIRSANQGGNTDVTADPDWYPLGGQATNTRGPNFTPPFPAYVSGHATIGGALFQIMRHYYPDSTKFTFISDEWNGMNTDAISGKVRPLKPMTFKTFSEAEYQNAQSRVYLGVHWQFDADQGVAEGHKVADWVWANAFQPAR